MKPRFTEAEFELAYALWVSSWDGVGLIWRAEWSRNLKQKCRAVLVDGKTIGSIAEKPRCVEVDGKWVWPPGELEKVTRLEISRTVKKIEAELNGGRW
jgi:hypothetical protein